jgi:hypothetical protein
MPYQEIDAVGKDWVESRYFLPGSALINAYLLIDDGKGLSVFRWGQTDAPPWYMNAGSRWKRLPDGHCKHCGAGRQS